MTDKAQVSKGTIIRFIGYADLAGEKPLLTKGEDVRVVGFGENGAVQVQSVDNEANADTLFPDEFALIEEGAENDEQDIGGETEEQPLAGITFDPEAPVADLRKIATDNGTKAAGRSKDDVIASLEAQGATAQEAEAVEVEAEVVEEAPKAAEGSKITSRVAVPENTDIVQIVHSPRVKELLEAQDALTAAKALSQQAEEAFFSLGGVLSDVHEGELHKTILDENGEPKYAGNGGFRDYAFNELNVNYRKAMNLIAIYRAFREFDLPEERAIKIGWTKLREIIPVMEDKNADALLDSAETLTRDELVDHVKITYVNADEGKVEKVKKTRLTFNLFEQNAEVVQNALAAAKEIGEVSTPEQALVLICAEWGQLTGNIEVSLKDQIEALEQRFGVQIGVREGSDRDEVEQEEAELEAAE